MNTVELGEMTIVKDCLRPLFMEAKEGEAAQKTLHPDGKRHIFHLNSPHKLIKYSSQANATRYKC